MTKTIQFGDEEVQFSTAFAWCFIYKSQFGADPAKIVIPAIRKVYATTAGDENEEENDEMANERAFALFEEIGFVGIVQIAWAMAKLCDRTIPDPLTWISKYGDSIPTLDLVTELFPDIIESCFTTKKADSPIPAPKEPGKKSTSK